MSSAVQLEEKHGSSILEVTQLTKTYVQPGESIEVLKGVDFSIESGQSVAILGQSGSGKSTLLALLAGLDHPTSGQVVLVGKNLAALNESQLARFRLQHMGIVFQQFHLMPHLSALENVILPLEMSRKEGAEDIARSALASVGLSHRLKHFPKELSGGEKQRVAIARAMVVKPSVLLADEPSGNLDARTGAEVMDLLFRMSDEEQTTLILVTHNQELARHCLRRYQLIDGTLKAIS